MSQTNSIVAKESKSSIKNKPHDKVGPVPSLQKLEKPPLPAKRGKPEPRKSVLILKCKTNQENKKAVNLSIGKNLDHDPDTCNLSKSEESEEILELQAEIEEDTGLVEDSPKKKKLKLKLKFIDEIHRESVVHENVDTKTETRTEGVIHRVSATERKKSLSIHNASNDTNIDVVPFKTFLLPSQNKIDVASCAKENIMYRMKNKYSDTSLDDFIISSLANNTLASVDGSGFFLDDDATSRMECVEESAVEETIEEEESLSTTAFTRDLYQMIYLRALKGFAEIKATNDFLHKKLSQYFIKRHMQSALIEVENPLENYKKYLSKLETMDRLIFEDSVRRECIDLELKTLEENNSELAESAKAGFDSLLQREFEIGNGLTFTKSNKELTETAVRNILNIQRKKMAELQQMRVTHIKIRNANATKSFQLKEMEKLGGGLTRHDYDHLKTMNRTYLDKVEERDVELARLRNQYVYAATSLAHVREKIDGIELEKLEYEKKSKKVKDELLKARIALNKIRTKRDNCRKTTVKMKENSGMLVKDKLLVDMERCINDVKRMGEQLAAAEKEFTAKTERAEAIKFNYGREFARAEHLRKRLPKKQKEAGQNL